MVFQATTEFDDLVARQQDFDQIDQASHSVGALTPLRCATSWGRSWISVLPQ